MSAKNNFWDLANRPYTQLKLKILKEYLYSWAQIFFSVASKHKDWVKYQKVYYIDCFAGRGKYNIGNETDIIDGSPLIALNCALEFQKKEEYAGIKMNCIFVENDPKVSQNLEGFCNGYKGKINFTFYKQEDFNIVIDKILDEVKYHPAFFFIDPDGIKEMRKESLEKIVNRDGATDILINYIKGGVERITGLTKKSVADILNKNISIKNLKTIKRLTDFYGLDIFNNLDKNERERLKGWAESLLQSSNLKEIAVFDMPYFHKSDNIYYLLFASRKPIAKKIMTRIFKKAKEVNYKGQIRLDIPNNSEFEL